MLSNKRQEREKLKSQSHADIFFMSEFKTKSFVQGYKSSQTGRKMRKLIMELVSGGAFSASRCKLFVCKVRACMKALFIIQFIYFTYSSNWKTNKHEEVD